MSPPATSHGPIIQPMSVDQSIRSPAWRSKQCARSCAAFTGKPPWTCSAPFGGPQPPRDGLRAVAGKNGDEDGADGADREHGHGAFDRKRQEYRDAVALPYA